MGKREAIAPFALKGVNVINKSIDKELITSYFVPDDFSEILPWVNNLGASNLFTQIVIDNFGEGPSNYFDMHSCVMRRSLPVVHRENFDLASNFPLLIGRIEFWLECSAIILHSDISTQFPLRVFFSGLTCH